MEAIFFPLLFGRLKNRDTWPPAPVLSELTCECGFGCGLLALGNISLSMVTSWDRCVFNSVTIDVGLDVPPLQGDAVVCLGDTAKVLGCIQACLGRERRLHITPGTRIVDLTFLSEVQKAPAHGWKRQSSPQSLSWQLIQELNQEHRHGSFLNDLSAAFVFPLFVSEEQKAPKIKLWGSVKTVQLT